MIFPVSAKRFDAQESAIGSVDQVQLETLMARGLSPDEAVDRIILGMLG